MKRKSVTLYLNKKHEPLRIEAYCHKCVCWKRFEEIKMRPPSHMRTDTKTVVYDEGHCFRYPRKVTKHEDSWCWEFQPDVDSADV